MKQKNIWMALVCYENDVSFSRACSTERKAEKAIIEYLRKEEGFDGKDFDDACFWIGENDLRLDLMVFEMEPEEFRPVWNSLALFRDDLPLREKGLYRVIYQIDVGADSAVKAAKTVHEIMTDTDSMPPVLEVIDNKGNKIEIDLSESKKGKADGK
jgi:hypothetical protein